MVGRKELLEADHIIEHGAVDLGGRIHLAGQIEKAIWSVHEGSDVRLFCGVVSAPLSGGIKVF